MPALALAALLCAAYVGYAAVRDRAAGTPHLAVAAAIEVVVLVQVVVAVVQLARGHRPESTATFLGYLVVTPLVLPFTGFIALDERTRWGSAALALGLVTVAALVGRLGTLW